MKIRPPINPDDLTKIRVVHFSGGRSSGMLAVQEYQAAKARGEEIIIVFCNTGMESWQTYMFLDLVNRQYLDGTLVYLERRETSKLFGHPKHEKSKLGFAVVDNETLHRGIDIFRGLHIREDYFFSNARARLCTQHLKMVPSFRYIYRRFQHLLASQTGDHLLHPHTIHRMLHIEKVIGFRADETGQRIARMRERAEAYHGRLDIGRAPLKWADDPCMPLVDAGVTQNNVLDFWINHPLEGIEFDILDMNVRLSNCVGCFFSNRAEKLRVALEDPEFARMWAQLERERHEKIKDKVTTDKSASKQKFAQRYLGRDAGIDDLERRGFALNQEATWPMYMEAVAKGALDNTGSNDEQLELPISGGCSDGYCNTD